MSTFNGNKNNCLNFSKIPLYLKDQILKKMNFKSFASFVQTGRMAESLNRRNQFRYPVDIRHLEMACDHVFISEVGRDVHLTLEMCKKMKFPQVEVTVNDMSLSQKTCDFLLKLDEISIFKCNFLENEDPTTSEFFKKANIQTLKMTTINCDYPIEEFPYDTRNIDNVEVDNCYPLMFDFFSSIKARRHVYLANVCVLSEQIIQHIWNMQEAEHVLDLTIDRYMISDFHEVILFLQDECTAVSNSMWAVTRMDEVIPFMTIELSGYCIHFRGF